MSEGWKDWERRIVAEAQARGLPWERRLRLGDNVDLLDVDGCLPGGWLIGCKSIRRGVQFGDKMSAAMDQCDHALANLGKPYTRARGGRLYVDCEGVIPVQIMQRQGFPVGKAYAVTEYGYLLDLAVRRLKWRDSE